jgi:hypothetical protein
VCEREREREERERERETERQRKGQRKFKELAHAIEAAALQTGCNPGKG